MGMKGQRKRRTTVDEYIAKQRPELQAIAKKLRDTVRKTRPISRRR